MVRGELWWATLGTPRGSAPEFRRPVLVVQVDSFNRSRLQTLVTVSLTSNLQRALVPGKVRLPSGTGGLAEPSVVNVAHVVAVDRADLVARIGVLPDSYLRQVEDGLRLMMGL